MRTPFLIDGANRTGSTRVGIAVADSDHDDVNSILSKADAALYQAKGSQLSRAVRRNDSFQS